MSNQRIALNTVAAYSRTLFAAGLALFSSRWVLASLGVSDFGLFSVVGSVIFFITFLNGVLAGSVARYLAFSMGQGDAGEVNRWFNAALSIHLVLACALIIAGLPVGGYVVSHVLTVPAERMAASLQVFRISLISAFFSMISVPFVAMFTAKQRISELAAWGMLQAALTFTLAFLLRHAPGDRLQFYAAGMVGIVVLLQLVQIFRAIALFEECRIVCRQWFDRGRFKAMFSFAVWNLIGSSGALLRDQGSALLLNLFFGPSVNAAYGVASQLSSQTNQLSTALVSAFAPEIIASEGRGDRARMLSLAERACKFGTILVILMAIPLMAEMEYVLKLWLRVPPPHTALFCQLIIGSFLIDRLSIGYLLAVQAHGRIAAYQSTLGTCLILTLPLAWMFLILGFPPTSIGIAFIATMTVTSFGRVWWGRRLLDVPVGRWINAVVWPGCTVALAAAAAATIPRLLMGPSPLRLLLVVSCSVLSSLVTAWLVAFSAEERDLLGQKGASLLATAGALMRGAS